MKDRNTEELFTEKEKEIIKFLSNSIDYLTYEEVVKILPFAKELYNKEGKEADHFIGLKFDTFSDYYDNPSMMLVDKIRLLKKIDYRNIRSCYQCFYKEEDYERLVFNESLIFIILNHRIYMGTRVSRITEVKSEHPYEAYIANEDEASEILKIIYECYGTPDDEYDDW